jgi:hypothetical protein
MHTHRFGRKLKLPSTIAIKHQIRKLMLEESLEKAEAGARVEAARAVADITDCGSVAGVGG